MEKNLEQLLREKANKLQSILNAHEFIFQTQKELYFLDSEIAKKDKEELLKKQKESK
jgi:hypothetical protein